MIRTGAIEDMTSPIPPSKDTFQITSKFNLKTATLRLNYYNPS